MLLRAGCHRPVPGGGVEIAASPDTPHRERWLWDLRLDGSSADRDRSPAHTAVLPVPRSDGSVSALAVTVDPQAVDPCTETLDVRDPAYLDRDVRELLALVVGAGTVLVDGRHLLGELDALVVTGDDVERLRVEREGDAAASVAVVRLRPAGEGSVGWVP